MNKESYFCIIIA